MENQNSKSEYAFSLAKELLDDIELSRLTADSLILKSTRLARVAELPEISEWLGYEMQGYNPSREISLRYMNLTGRWIDRKKNKAYWSPLGRIEANITSYRNELQTLRPQSLSGEHSVIVVNNLNARSNGLQSEIANLSDIRSRVLGHLHIFVSEVFYQKAFSGLAESIFEKYKMKTDAKLALQCGEVLTKLPYTYDRLADGEAESVSQALTTCRRVIDGFADNIFPATEETIEIGGNILMLSAQHHQNRINAFIAKRVESNSRRTRLRQTLSNLYGRVSAGVHSEVRVEEAQSLLLTTYLFLGEVLSLPDIQPE